MVPSLKYLATKKPQNLSIIEFFWNFFLGKVIGLHAKIMRMEPGKIIELRLIGKRNVYKNMNIYL